MAPLCTSHVPCPQSSTFHYVHPANAPPLLQISLVSVGNSIQAYTSIYPTQRVYPGPLNPPPTSPSVNPLIANSPVTPLAAHLFGTWTVIQSLVRLYAAYNIDNPRFYELAFLTYVVAFAHFGSEWFVFKSTRWGAGLAGPVVVATGSLVWMWVQWGFYVQ